jgi:hypothetical protein
MTSIRWLGSVWLLLACLPGVLIGEEIGTAVTADDDVVTPGIEELYRLDLLPRLKSSVFVGSVSSYDRTGGNDDGFSGTYSYVAKEDDGLVIADLQGPGIIYRIWTPTPTEDWIEFFFDGEAEPRIRARFRDLFTGVAEPFVTPLVGFGAGGFYSYVPLPYENSCKVVIRAPRVQFYQINYATYPDSIPIKTWSADSTPEERASRQRAQELFAASGSDVSDYGVPPGAPRAEHRRRVTVSPGEAAVLFETDTPGRVVGISLAPASALSGKARDLTLRMTWDGAAVPAVLVPAGDFFGYAWGRPAMKSLLVGTSEAANYCYFPMPFDRSAKIELVSDRTDGEPVEVECVVVFSPLPRRPDEGRFHAVWRRENPTTLGQPFTFFEGSGQGHLAGCILQAQGMVSGNTYFFEGDDETTIDGEMTIRGTGSEDFFNGGWYDVPDRWEKTLSFPLSGCLGYQKHLARTGGYRLMLGDAYAFRHSILQTIEHAPTNDDLETDYAGVTFLYLADHPDAGLPLPPVDQRGVVDLTEIIFTPAWSVPIRSFTFRGATLTKMDEEIDGEKTSFLRMLSGDSDWFGHPFLALECDIPAAGTYEVFVEAVKGPEQAMVRLFQNEVPAGDAIDLFAAQRSRGPRMSLGKLKVDEGPSTLMLKLVGQNEQATGWGLDLITVRYHRIE